MEVWWRIKRIQKPSIPNPVNSRRYTQELISHLAPCRPISTFADGMEIDPLMEITDSLLEMNQEAGNPALFGLNEDYSQSSLMTLDSYAPLSRWLENKRDLQQAALKDLSDGQEEKYERGLNKLHSHLRDTGGPFIEEISRRFQTACTQQHMTIERLQKGKKKLGKKLKFAKAWIKISRAILVSVFAAVIVCSVVAAVVASPPVAATVAIATTLPLGSFWKWIDSRMKKHEQASKRKLEAVGAMLAGSRIAINDLDYINAMIDELDVQIHSKLLNPQSVITQDEGVQIVKVIEDFMTSMEELADQAERYRTSTKRASTIVLQRIIKASS